MTNYGYGSRLVADLSRRDNRTQPGVLTPGIDKQGASLHKALRSRPRPRIRPNGVMDCGSVGVLRQVGVAPRDREVWDAEGAKEFSPVVRLLADSLGTTLYRPFRAGAVWANNPGLKPRAESYCPFGTRSDRFFQRGCCACSASLGPKKLN